MAQVDRVDFLKPRGTLAMSALLIFLNPLGGRLQAEDLGCDSDEACSVGHCIFKVEAEGGGVCTLHEAPLDGLPEKPSEEKGQSKASGSRTCAFSVDCAFGEACYSKNRLSAGGRCLRVPLETAP
ncbi:MAG: hypothetical protein EBY15_12855 [Gammaproteobacteria bacterium]|nr:hypothetical protein [Gammaproteobacteria bacterium]NDE57256.1 hypothetical protein [Gammaproteobacteria bacterium]NDG88817.1 hypothetical protein [Gammaproteobacteria bacterium]